MAAMSASMAPAAGSRGATSWSRGSSNMGETQPVAMIVGVACSLVALVLAWRAYRGASAEHERAQAREREALTRSDRRSSDRLFGGRRGSSAFSRAPRSIGSKRSSDAAISSALHQRWPSVQLRSRLVEAGRVDLGRPVRARKKRSLVQHVACRASSCGARAFHTQRDGTVDRRGRSPRAPRARRPRQSPRRDRPCRRS